MKNYLQHDNWNIIENGFSKEHHQISESLFSIGNGKMGQRGNFEEHYSGASLQGTYVAGVYYPDKTRVGWWKNGYPEYFAKVLNAPNWIGINIEVDGEQLDLAKAEVKEFQRILNMQEGFLERKCHIRMPSGKEFRINSKRFCSIAEDEIGAIRYSITPLNFEGTLNITPYLDADIANQDSNYEEKFWLTIDKDVNQQDGYILAETKKTGFQVCTGMAFKVFKNGDEKEVPVFQYKKEKYIACSFDLECNDLDEIVIYKYAAVLASLNYEKEHLIKNCQSKVQKAMETGFEKLLEDQANAWAKKWEEADIKIEGDVAAQQGIRFNIFQLYQTYTGQDERLNIGPKGFTGEKYGGSTYWDTEAYCIPFYLATAEPKVARQLLIYRHNQLQKAIENAAKLGFEKGAALYPMVTMNGEECHNEWEITFEEIHRNGAIAYAIFDYIQYTGDRDYLIEYGLEVLIAICRFWAQRVHFSSRKQQYVMHGVTGPNEYENNVNNNWYTNYIAVWCLKYTVGAISFVEKNAPEAYAKLEERIKFYKFLETNHWKDIAEKMYFPKDEKLGIFEQADGFFDKDWEKTVDDLKEKDSPICQNWSWDRILRSVYIKQADVLQGLYFFEPQFDTATIEKNFDFYEPRTVHESSLSPCVHSILAAKLGKYDKAYEMYLRTARLDLDDYNNDTEDGCHITSMAGTWMAFVKGFGGMRTYADGLEFDPFIPKNWTSYAFKIKWRGYLVEVEVGQKSTKIRNHSTEILCLEVAGKEYEIEGNGVLEV